MVRFICSALLCLYRPPDADKQTVVHQLLNSLVECMKPELVVHLIGRLQESADGTGKGGGRHEVLAFVEVLAGSRGEVILTRCVL